MFRSLLLTFAHFLAADELIGSQAVEAFGVAMGRLRAAAAAAKAQGDAESCGVAVAAALRCHGQLFDMASRGGAILREVRCFPLIFVSFS